MCDGRNNIVRVGKNSGPVLSRLWTKVHEIFGQCRRPFVLSSAIVRLSASRFVQKIFAIRCRSRWKPNKCKSFLASISLMGDRPHVFYSRLLAWFTIRRLAKLSWVPFAVLRLRSLHRKQNLHRVGKMVVQFQAVCGSKFMRFWDDVGEGAPLYSLQRNWPIV